MALQRIWFPRAPSGSVNAPLRAQMGVGYGGIIISSAAASAIDTRKMRVVHSDLKAVLSQPKLKEIKLINKIKTPVIINK